jgi:branched-chain amino acid aminotransferase
MYPTRLAQQQGFDQVLWTDGETHTFLEETGTSNVFVVTEDTVYTPELTDSLLAGITRASVIDLLRDKGLKVVETHIGVSDLIEWHKNGDLLEMFVTGTAATVTNIELFNFRGKDYKLDCSNTADLLSTSIKETLNGIRTGAIADKFHWMTPLQQTETV